jgi:hypothetical protein
MTRRSIGIVLLAFAIETTAFAQEPAVPPVGGDESIKLQVTVTKFMDGKKVSAVPYELSVRPDGPKGQLRMGVEVPVATPSGPSTPEKPAMTLTTYRAIGTNIDASAAAAGNGRFRVDLLIEDSSVSNDKTIQSAALLPVFRAFRSSNLLVLRDGQRTQFTAATDKLTGESITVEVALSVLR